LWHQVIFLKTSDEHEKRESYAVSLHMHKSNSNCKDTTHK